MASHFASPFHSSIPGILLVQEEDGTVVLLVVPNIAQLLVMICLPRCQAVPDSQCF